MPLASADGSSAASWRFSVPDDTSSEATDGELPELEPADVRDLDEVEPEPRRGRSDWPSRRFRVDLGVDGAQADFGVLPGGGAADGAAAVGTSTCGGALGSGAPGGAADATAGDVRLVGDDNCEDLYEREYGYPAWPQEMKDPDYFKREFRMMRTDPRHNRNLGREMDQAFWNEAARQPWAKVLMRREQHWTDRKNVWLQQYNTVVRNNRGREEVGEMLEGCPAEIKRLVAPILKYKVVEAVLLSVNDEAKETGVAFEALVQRPEILLELQSARRRLDQGGASEAQRMQDHLDALMARASRAVEDARRREAHARGRVLIDMEGLKAALEYGQKCKQDGLIEWQRGNAQEALASWRQGDETLRRFRAPAHCVDENDMIFELHGALLRNVAQAAIRLEGWGEALDAADRALEMTGEDHKAWFRRACALEGLGRFDEARRCLERIEDIAVGRADRERLVRDCQQKRSRLSSLEDRHAADHQRMLQRVVQRGVFSSERAAPVQAAAPAGALRAAAPGAGGRKKGPTPEQVAACESRKRLTRDGAWDLLGDLHVAYSDPWFVRRVDKLIRDVQYEARAFMSHLGGVALEAQKPVLAKWGFEASGTGVLEMRAALQDYTRGPGADPRLKQRADEANRALYGSPGLRMFERVTLGV